MIINANTTIGTLLKQNPEALEAIIRISPKFAKLRNPILRKLMAGRATLAMAAKIGGCKVKDFYEQLTPLGFEIDMETLPDKAAKKTVPFFVISLKPKDIVDLDVRAIIESGVDPLDLIVEKIKTIQPGQALKIINNFEPVPLIGLLEKRGFTSYTDAINDNLVETYFYKQVATLSTDFTLPTDAADGWEDMLLQFKGHIETIDVRALEMPLPMMTILDALENLPAQTALLVHHKRIPVFLLPELAGRKFDYRIKEISDGEVNLLIYKN